MSFSEIPVHAILTSSSDTPDMWSLYPLIEEMARVSLGLRKSGPLRPEEMDRVVEGAYSAVANVTRYRDGFRGVTESEARAWLWKVTRNAAVRAAVRNGRRRRLEAVTDPEVLGRIQDRERSESCRAGVARDALNLLETAIPNESWRELWLLHNLPDAPLDHESLAARIGRTPGSVAVTLSRVRQAIRRAMEPAPRR